MDEKRIVIKFESVEGAGKIKNAAKIAITYTKEGCKVVVIVSAMAGVTNRLTCLARKIASAPNKREMDLILSSGERVSSALTAMAIQELGYRSISLTGRQAGILTDNAHADAAIKDINTDRIIQEFSNGRIPVVAGFQGINEFSDVTTLKRGGLNVVATTLSDALNAVAIVCV